MALQYRTKNGDVLDYLCWKHYGQQAGAVERVLEANRGLAGYGPVLPAGILITLPSLPEPVQEVRSIRLWD
uniref:P2-like prophage tail protein X n=1 Tax=Candidatus Kentrum sp. DK TaxID=2126562 RepID=A0A450TLV0_9GAMM|nr:MAG: P2-like prophage tail protein X [Candidatus Kentron sp. DK]